MISIEQGGIQDVDLIIELVSALITELDGKMFTTTLSKKEIIQWITDEQYLVFIARHKQTSQPVGIITLTETRSIYANGSFGVIEELYVKPEFRSQHIGSQMLSYVISFGETKKWTRLEVGAPDKEHWMNTFNFYQNNDFIEVGPRLKIHLKK